MDPIWQVLFNGIGVGAVYGLVAIGVQVVIGVSRIPNFANGQYYMLGAYIALFLSTLLNMSYFAVIVITILAVGAIGVVSERVAIRPLLKRPRSAGLLSTLGLGIFIEGAALIFFTASPRIFSTPYVKEIISMGSVSLSQQRLIMILGGISAFILIDRFLMMTKVGKGLRAMSQNKEACALFGIDIFKMSMISFALGTALAGFAAGLAAPLFAVSPHMGSLIIFKAFAVIIIAGIGEVRGVMASSILLGLAESLGAFYVSTLLKESIAFTLMILILLFRPQGLFGEKIELLFKK